MPATSPRRRTAPRPVVLEEWGMELRPLKPLGFRPADVVVAISSEGIVGPLAATDLIQQLGMDQVCAIESPSFPPVSVVYFHKPKFPARIYASRRHRLAVVVAEFAPMPELARPLAAAILAWCRRQRAGRVIGVEGLFLDDPAFSGVAAVGSTPSDHAAIARAQLNRLEHGVVTGVAGVLLNEGRWHGRPTVALLAALGADRPDVEAAGHVVAAVKALRPALPLHPQARAPTELEKAVRAARERTSHELI